MSKVFKNTKQMLAFVLAFALLAMSMFTGVVFTAGAATKDKVVYFTMDNKDNWGEDSSYLNSEGRDGSAEHPYLISTPAHLRHLAKKSTYEGTVGKYFEIDPTIKTIVFQREKYVNDVLGGLDTFLTKDADTVKTLLSTADNRVNFATSGGKFSGHLNGNGVEFVGLYTDQGGFCYEVDSVASFENISFKNNYITSDDYAGMVFGKATATNTNTVVEMSNIEVANCYIESTSTNKERAGVLYGGLVVNWNAVKHFGSKVTNLFVHDNKAFANTNVEAGVFGTSNSAYSGLDADKPQNLDFSNSVILDCAPYGLYDNNQGTRSQWYKNIYTNNACEIKPAAVTAGWCQWKDYDITIINADDVKGSNALTAMPKLAWGKDWLADKTAMPELASSHTKITLVNKGDKHAATCECGFGGVEVAHVYGKDGKCDCGAIKPCNLNIKYWNGTTASITKGSGTKENPYIIENAEQLAQLAFGTDVAVSVGKFYKVADDVDVIILQPESVVDAKALMALDSADAVKEYFENLEGKLNWGDKYSWKVFDGNFDGNGVQVYGMYVENDGTKGFAPALFPAVDGGKAGTQGNVNTDNEGVIFKNIAIKNSYIKSSHASKGVGALIGESYINGYGAYVNGHVTIDGCEVSNNYMETKDGKNSSGVLVGLAVDETYTIKNCLVYGNDATNTKDETSFELPLYPSADGSRVITPAVEGVSEAVYFYNTVEDSVILGTTPYNLKVFSWRSSIASCFKNVFTDAESGDVTFEAISSAGAPYEQTYADNNIKTITSETIEDFVKEAKTLDWSNVFAATEDEILLRSFHNFIKFVAKAGDGHTETCACGKTTVTIPHTFGDDHICTACKYACTHTGKTWQQETAGDCVTAPTGKYVCDCGYESEVAAKEDFEAGHTFGEVVPAKTITCVSDGTVAYKHCSVCDNDFADTASNTEPMANALTTIVSESAKGHTFGGNVDANPATCTENGNVAYKHCSVCEKDFDVNADIKSTEYLETTVVSATGHTFGEDIEATAATCTEDATVAHRHCSKCDKDFDLKADEKSTNPLTTIVEEGTATGHTFGEVVPAKTVTCVSDGTVAYKHCSVCEKDFDVNADIKSTEYLETTVVSATGHQNVEFVAEVSATTTTEGTKEHYICKDCEKLFEDEDATKEVKAEDLAFGTTIGSNGAANADTSNTSPKTSETSATPIALVTALVGVAFVTFRKVKKA